LKNNVIKKRTNCRGCLCDDLVKVFHLNPSPIGDEYLDLKNLRQDQPSYPIDLYLCQRCGLAQLIDVINPDVLYSNYIYKTESSVGLKDHFAGYANEVIKKIGLNINSNILDIGSNDGTLLGEFKKNGMNVIGVEPASKIADYANQKGITTLNLFFDEKEALSIKEQIGTFDLITSNNVFANIDDIRSWVKGINHLLNEKGVFVFESSYLLDVINNLVFDFIYHEHLTSFSISPVKKLFNEFKLDLFAVQHVDTKGGSLRYFIQRNGGIFPHDGSVEKYLKIETERKIYSFSTYKKFRSDIDLLKKHLIRKLSSIKTKGETIAGFGASITGTTLIYDFEIGEFLDFLVDDNPDKIGRFSPGLKLPVHSSSSLLEKKPDYVVILAWRFAKQIVSKNKDYIDIGGKFIVPVPEYLEIKNG